MDDNYLTTEEFNRWAVDDRLFKQRVLNNLASLQHNDSQLGERIAVVETEVASVKQVSRSTTLKWGTGITAVIMLIVEAVSKWMGR